MTASREFRVVSLIHEHCDLCTSTSPRDKADAAAQPATAAHKAAEDIAGSENSAAGDTIPDAPADSAQQQQGTTAPAHPAVAAHEPADKQAYTAAFAAARHQQRAAAAAHHGAGAADRRRPRPPAVRLLPASPLAGTRRCCRRNLC